MKNDAQLKDDVEQELRWDPSVKDIEIGVSVKNGVVELDGHVDSYWKKWSAERAALRVANVKGIASEIEWVNENSQEVVGAIDEWVQRGIANVAAVPVVCPVDLDGAKESW